mgnify:CR=1 FL=1
MQTQRHVRARRQPCAQRVLRPCRACGSPAGPPSRGLCLSLSHVPPTLIKQHSISFISFIRFLCLFFACSMMHLCVLFLSFGLNPPAWQARNGRLAFPFLLLVFFLFSFEIGAKNRAQWLRTRAGFSGPPHARIRRDRLAAPLPKVFHGRSSGPSASKRRSCARAGRDTASHLLSAKPDTQDSPWGMQI